MKIIQDKKEFLKFYDKLYELEKDELFFISLSARNKYLTEEERLKYSLGRTEMFGREFIKGKDLELFDYTFKKLEALMSYKTTSNRSLIPEKALVVYFNINPTSSIKAVQVFIQEMQKEMYSLINDLDKDNDTHRVYSRFKNAKSILNTQFQKYTSRKIFIDVDFDTKDFSIVTMLTEKLDENNVEYFVIETQGGFHVAIKRGTCSKYVNYMLYTSWVKNCDKIAKDIDKDNEVIINKNEMIPLPGTLQANHLVKLRES